MEQEKDYSLLRPFDLEAAKRGDAICYKKGAPATYISGPNRHGTVIMQLQDDQFAMSHTDRIRMAPLCWVEGRPVYKGDVLYDKEYGTRQVVRCAGPHDTLETDQPRSDGAFIIGLEDATWTQPKVKREGWVNVYSTDAPYLVSFVSHAFGSKIDADKHSSYDRIACVHIEWEE